MDKLSLGFGPSDDFAVHDSFLPAHRWGMEAVASLVRVTPAGAALVVCGPKNQGASGGPSWLIALF